MSIGSSTHYPEEIRVPVGTRASFQNPTPSRIDSLDAPRVIVGSRSRSSSDPIKVRQVSVGTRSTSFDHLPADRVPVGDRAFDNRPQVDFALNLPSTPDHIPVYIPPETPIPFNSTYDLPPFQEPSSEEEPSVQDPILSTGTDFSDLLAPIAKIQKKMKLGTIAMAVAAVAFTVLGTALLFSGSALGLLPIFVAIPLCYIGYNGYQVSENIARIIKNPGQILSDQAIQIDSQKIKQSLKEKTLYFDWAINRGTDHLLNTAVQG